MKISRVEIKVILTKKSHAALGFLTFFQTFLLWLCASWSSDVKLFVNQSVRLFFLCHIVYGVEMENSGKAQPVENVQ